MEKRKKKRNVLSRQHSKMLKTFDKEEALRRWLLYQQLKKQTKSATLEKYVLLYGDILGKQKWDEHIKKINARGTKQYYIDKFGEKEGLKKYLDKNSRLSVSERALKSTGKTDDEIREIKKQHKNNSLISEEKYIKQYGIEKGKARYQDLNERKGKNGVFGLDYWLKKCDNNLELAKQSLSDSQKRDINFFIKLYGEIQGRSKFEQFVKKITKNWKCKDCDSKGQIEVEGFVKNIVKNSKVYGYQERWVIFLNKEEIRKLNQKVIYPDILIKNFERKLVIEYFGEYWHCHESLFPDENMIFPTPGQVQKTIKEIRNEDFLKRQIIENRSFKYFVVWEHDWFERKEEIKNKILEVVNEIDK